MPQEIERKFLVIGDGWRNGATKHTIRQGYLSDGSGASVRVRVADDRACLTIKSSKPGLVRSEFEYPIPRVDADELLDTLCRRPLIEKARYTLVHDHLEWDVDVFEGENAGLIIAEVELHAETDSVSIPEWAGDEVTNDPRYLNASLSENPYRLWGDVDKTRTAKNTK